MNATVTFPDGLVTAGISARLEAWRDYGFDVWFFALDSVPVAARARLAASIERREVLEVELEDGTAATGFAQTDARIQIAGPVRRPL